MERSKPRVGLSQYTTSRLAELRARRAAQEDDFKTSTGLGSRGNLTQTPTYTSEFRDSTQHKAHINPVTQSSRRKVDLSPTKAVKESSSSAVICIDQTQTDVSQYHIHEKRASTADSNFCQGSQNISTSPRLTEVSSLKSEVNPSHSQPSSTMNILRVQPDRASQSREADAPGGYLSVLQGMLGCI